jgi:hypothetical protein
MKKVRRAAAPPAKTPDPTNRALRLRLPGIDDRGSYVGLRVVASRASWASDSLANDGSRRPFCPLATEDSRRRRAPLVAGGSSCSLASFLLARARLNASLSGIRLGGRATPDGAGLACTRRRAGGDAWIAFVGRAAAAGGLPFATALPPFTAGLLCATGLPFATAPPLTAGGGRSVMTRAAVVTGTDCDCGTRRAAPRWPLTEGTEVVEPGLEPCPGTPAAPPFERGRTAVTRTVSELEMTARSPAFARAPAGACAPATAGTPADAGERGRTSTPGISQELSKTTCRIRGPRGLGGDRTCAASGSAQQLPARFSVDQSLRKLIG